MLSPDRKAYLAKWREKNRARIRAQQANYRNAHLDDVRRRARIWAKNNPAVRRAWMLRATPEQRQRGIASSAAWINRKRKACLAFRLLTNLRNRVYKAVLRKAGRTLALTGCSPSELVIHLEKQFVPGMNWENYGKLWEIDHIRPCETFDLRDPEQQKVCFHFSNLRPLDRYTNRSRRFYAITSF